MRDFTRIRKVLNRFGDLWEMFPDMRFFQLIDMIDFQYKGQLFFLEEDELLQAIERTIEKYTVKHL